MASSAQLDMSQKTPGDSEGQGSLACCSPQGHKESNAPWGLNDNTKQQMSNVDSTALYCKKIPSRTFTARGERSTPGFKASQDKN